MLEWNGEIGEYADVADSYTYTLTIIAIKCTVYGSATEPVYTLDNVTLYPYDRIYVPMNVELTFTNIVIYRASAGCNYISNSSEGISDFSQTSVTQPFSMTFKVTGESAKMAFFLQQIIKTITFIGVDIPSPGLYVRADGQWKMAKDVYVKANGHWSLMMSRFD